MFSSFESHPPPGLEDRIKERPERRQAEAILGDGRLERRKRGRKEEEKEEDEE